MRTRFALIVFAVVALASGALAQRRTTTHAEATHPAASGGSSSSPQPAAAVDVDASASVSDAAGGSAATSDASVSATVTQNSFDIPMVQRGTGSMTHYPIPEQLVRNDIPVFVQVRSSAPIDHVSIHYRGRGARNYTEVRMAPVGGQPLALPNGYGAVVPCEDAFPPAVEYYVDALATSGVVVGSAGTTTDPISVPIVRERTRNIVPTLPGQPQPRNCGGLTGPAPQSSTAGAGSPRTGGATGATPEAAGTADLGEPCTRNNDCRHGLRCGTNHHCVFIH